MKKCHCGYECASAFQCGYCRGDTFSVFVFLWAKLIKSVFQEVLQFTVEFLRILEEKTVSAAGEDDQFAVCAQMLFHIFAMGRAVNQTVSAVS